MCSCDALGDCKACQADPECGWNSTAAACVNGAPAAECPSLCGLWSEVGCSACQTFNSCRWDASEKRCVDGEATSSCQGAAQCRV